MCASLSMRQKPRKSVSAFVVVKVVLDLNLSLVGIRRFEKLLPNRCEIFAVLAETRIPGNTAPSQCDG